MLHSAGIGRYLRQLLPGVFERAGERRTLLGDVAAMAMEGLGEIPGVELAPAMSPIYSISEQFELLRRVPPETDLFWAPHYNVPLLHRGRLMVTVHDVLHLARPEFVRGAHRRAYARAMFAAVRARADAIVCDSAFTADELARHAGIDRERLVVIHPGLEERWWEPVVANRPLERPYLFFAGNLKPHKNLVRLLDAFESIADEIPHDLVLAGRRDGFITGDDEVAGRAARLGDRVHLPGEVGDVALRAYLAHADAMVFPSLYEGFGYPPVEAMAVGCPVVTSSAASMPEVCGDAALYFDPTDVPAIAAGMKRVVGDEGLRAELRAAGRERARLYPASKCAAETRQVMDGVLGG